MKRERREGLKMMFSVGFSHDVDKQQIGQAVTWVPQQVCGLNEIYALRILCGIMQKTGLPTKLRKNVKSGENWIWKEEASTFESYLKRLEKQGEWKGNLAAGGLEFTSGKVFGHSYVFVCVEEQEPGIIHSWEDWVSPFLGLDGFVQARIFDREYDVWQNIVDPIAYELEGRNYDHLPMKRRDAPPPLDKMIIDTSQNSGRMTYRDNYEEAIGATMWLSPLFWRYVGEERKKNFLDARDLEVQRLENGILKVTAANKCFYDESTVVIQRKLRAMLYGT